LEVKFINEENGVQLGCRTYDGITHTIIPAFNKTEHDIYFTKTFLKETHFKSWLIKSIKVTENGVEIYISGNLIPDSVDTYAQKQYRKFNSIIRKHNIIEVDFGHETTLFSLGSGEQKNTVITDALMPGEMHKKRPCIVMGTKGTSVTVIPLTTKDYNNPKHVFISPNSFQNLHERYSARRSFAALDMVQTVSAHRVFPPRDNTGKYRHQYSKYKLSAEDGTNVDKTLADIYNDEVTKKLKITQQSLANVTKEKSRIFEKYREIASDIDTLNTEKATLEGIIKHIAKEFSINGTFEEVLEQLKLI
jgi:uncharacterized protein YifN (PemK superfamily)